MKKLLLTSACVLAMTSAVFAQGTVNWTTSPAYVTAQTNSTTYSPLFGGGATGTGAVGGTATTPLGFYYELLYTAYSGSPATITSLSSLLSWSDTGLSATNTILGAGRLAAVATSTAATVPWSNGTTQSVVLVGWSANLGSTWATVANELNTQTTFAPGSFFGYSNTGYLNPGTGNPGVNVFGNGATTYGLPIYSLNTQLYALPVPEPATFAVAGLGGLALLAFRRRK